MHSGLSLRKFCKAYGLNQKHFWSMVSDGTITVSVRDGIRRSVTVISSRMTETVDYVTCLSCGARLGLISPRHLKSCCGLSLEEYKERYPNAQVMCSRTADKKKKSPDQKRRQSETLLARFQTEAGQITRKQISEAASRPEVAAKARSNLIAYLRSPEGKRVIDRKRRERWSDPSFREKMAERVQANMPKLAASVAHARTFSRPTSKVHLKFKQELLSRGYDSFKTEYPLGYYSLDEADPTLLIALEIDGCYWHGCPICGYDPPPKVARRDKAKSTFLANHGWTLVRLRECELKHNLSECIARVDSAISERRPQ